MECKALPSFNCIFIQRSHRRPTRRPIALGRGKEWLDLFNGSGGLREWDNRWEATSKMAMEARSFCNLGAGGNREARQGPTHNVRGGPEGRECPTRRQSFSSLSRRAAKLRERERERERAVRLEVKAMNISGVDERQAVHHRTARADGWTRRGKIPGQSLKLRNFASLIQAKFLYVLRSRLSPR